MGVCGTMGIGKKGDWAVLIMNLWWGVRLGGNGKREGNVALIKMGHNLMWEHKCIVAILKFESSRFLNRNNLEIAQAQVASSPLPFKWYTGQPVYRTWSDQDIKQVKQNRLLKYEFDRNIK